MPAWPATLPKLDQGSYNEALGETNVRTSMDAGPDFVRPRFSAAPTFVSGDLNMTSAQLADFMTFYKTTLTNGVSAFDWVNQRTDVAAVYRFRGPPVVRAISGTDYLVSVTLEVMP